MLVCSAHRAQLGSPSKVYAMLNDQASIAEQPVHRLAASRVNASCWPSHVTTTDCEVIMLDVKTVFLQKMSYRRTDIRTTGTGARPLAVNDTSHAGTHSKVHVREYTGTGCSRYQSICQQASTQNYCCPCSPNYSEVELFQSLFCVYYMVLSFFSTPSLFTSAIENDI